MGKHKKEKLSPKACLYCKHGRVLGQAISCRNKDSVFYGFTRGNGKTCEKWEK